MVQRKSQDKLGIRIIQVDLLSHDQNNQKSLKKPCSSQNQDVKTRGPEVKKKMMKKPRSFKLSELGQQSLKSSYSSNMSRPKKAPMMIVEASPPNYMKSTTCFDARKEKQTREKPAKSSAKTLTKMPSFKHSKRAVSSAKSSSRAPHVDLQRATCSSTIKDSKFPSYLVLDHGGTESEGASVVKVCPYTYCSLNGHIHKHASLPPLKRYLSAKRRALKTAQESAKLPMPCDEGAAKVGIDFFIEIYAENEGKACFEIDAEESLGKFDQEEEEEEEKEESLSIGNASDMECEEGEFSGLEIEDEELECGQVHCDDDEDTETTEIFMDDVESIAEPIEEMGGVFETEENSTSSYEAKTDEINEEHNVNEKVKKNPEIEESRDVLEESGSNKITSSDDHNDAELEASETGQSAEPKQKWSSSAGEQESEDEEHRIKWGINKREIKDSADDPTREFNPREPNYLPLAEDPEGEKIDLKHQDMDERKNSEDWMIDRALQQAVTKLGPARKRRVALLVEAFETVTPITKEESLNHHHQLHHHHHHHHHHHNHPSSPVFQHPIMHIQACN